MSTVQAEFAAAQALRDYLLRALPAKVDSLNAGRAAVLRAPRAGPYTVPAGAKLVIGTSIGTVLGTVDLTSGTRTAQQVADELNAAALAGVTFGVDAKERLYMESATAPSGNTRSELWLGPDAVDGSNAAFGWGPGGQEVAVSALVAPGYDGISDGEPEVVDMGAGFWVVLGQRSTAPRENIRSDIHRVTLNASVYAAEPSGRVAASQEFISQAVRAVREVVLEDRTLDGAVFLTELPSIQYEARAFRFRNPNGVSGLFSEARMTFLIQVFERS